MRVLAVDHGTTDDEALLDLAHEGESDDAKTTVGDLDDPNRLGDDKVMQLAEWVYQNVEEVWSGFNLLAEATARGYTATPNSDEAEERVRDWERRVRIQDKVRMWVKNALVYGRSVMEAGDAYLRVRNPRTMDLDQDEDGTLVGVTQRIADGDDREVPVEDVHVFQLHSLFSDDLEGISAVHPVLQTLDGHRGGRRLLRRN
jgi:hypothetical protein